MVDKYCVHGLLDCDECRLLAGPSGETVKSDLPVFILFKGWGSYYPFEFIPNVRLVLWGNLKHGNFELIICWLKIRFGFSKYWGD